MGVRVQQDFTALEKYPNIMLNIKEPSLSFQLQFIKKDYTPKQADGGLNGGLNGELNDRQKTAPKTALKTAPKTAQESTQENLTINGELNNQR